MSIRQTKPFRRRIYRRIDEFFEDVRGISANRTSLRQARANGPISPAFRERLMLAVTAVNQCRYCQYFHAALALNSGVTPGELAELTAGALPADCPDDEQIGVLYAQHWAEQDARPDPTTRERLVDVYGEEKASAIETYLRMIRIGNLAGNTFDYWLYRLSFGLLGNG